MTERGSFDQSIGTKRCDRMTFEEKQRRLGAVAEGHAPSSAPTFPGRRPPSSNAPFTAFRRKPRTRCPRSAQDACPHGARPSRHRSETPGTGRCACAAADHIRRGCAAGRERQDRATLGGLSYRPDQLTLLPCGCATANRNSRAPGHRVMRSSNPDAEANGSSRSQAKGAALVARSPARSRLAWIAAWVPGGIYCHMTEW